MAVGRDEGVSVGTVEDEGAVGDDVGGKRGTRGSSPGVRADLGGTGGRLLTGVEDGTYVVGGEGVLTGVSVEEVEVKVELVLDGVEGVG